MIFVILALNVIGLINLYSATHGAASSNTSQFFIQQILWLILGWTLFFILTIIDYDFFKRFAYFFYSVNLLALIITLKFGKVSYGAQRWLDLGFFRYQPSDTMKLALVILLAHVLSERVSTEGLGFRGLAWPAILTFLPAGLIIKQPDLGTGLLLIAIFFSMILYIKVRRSVLIFFFVSGLVAAPIAWSFGLKQYQKQRVLTFLNPGKDSRGAGYNSIQSRIAVGSGKIIGKGFRKGTQSQLEFLPERHTDFIFSVLSEENGFIGSMITLGLFMLLLLMGARTASEARDRFGAILAVGSVAILFWHVTINISMIMGLMPIVGVPLPLLSYGGSIMITTMSSLGLISAVAYRKFLF
jgi:rod shape determining protein RodA